MSAPRKASGGRCFLILILLGGTGLAGACCVGVAVLAPVFWLVEEKPSAKPTQQAAAAPDAASKEPIAEKKAPEPIAPPLLPKAPPPEDPKPKAPKKKAPKVELPKPEPPKTEPPEAPKGPLPPIHVMFDSDGDFTHTGKLDRDDPDPRGTFQCCRRFVINATAGTAYLLDIDQPAIAVRVESSGGGPPIEPKGFDAKAIAAKNPKGPRGGKHTQRLFIADGTQAYVVFALGRLADLKRDFTLRIRACDGSEALPDALRLPTAQTLPTIDVVQPSKDRRFVGMAFAPDGKSFWTSNHDMTLDRWQTGGAGIGTYKLRKRLYALAVDRKGRLYAQPGPAEKNSPALAVRTVGDIDVYEKLDFKGETDDLPRPARAILVRGLVGRLLVSLDGRWVYYLDVLNGKVGRIDTDAGIVDRIIDEVSAGTNAFCMSPDGKKIYTCSAQGHIDVIDVEKFAVKHTVELTHGKPYEIAATDKGMAFVLVQELGEWACAAVDLTRDGDRAVAVPLPCRGRGQSLRLSADQATLLIGADHRVTACTVPTRPIIELVLHREMRVSDIATPGWLQISPDGHTILHDSGAILSLHR